LTNEQLYLAIGMPIVFNATITALFFTMLNSRMSSLENRFTALEAKVDRHFEIMIGKIGELETRVAALETKLG
jgi:hypothetical protein